MSDLRKRYLAAPLPFMGQKRGFARRFAEIVTRFPANTVFVDLFGGSGLLSHLARISCPDARVIYNDFDGFARRLEAIPQTNRLLSMIRQIAARTPKPQKMPDSDRQQILDILRHEEQQSGYIDVITLSASLLFSGKFASSLDELAKHPFYAKCRSADIPPADDYLDGVEVVSCDYRRLADRFSHRPGVVFIVDPPYLQTATGHYTMTWRLADYLDVLTILPDNDFIFFTSNKSQLIELCDWMARHPQLGDPLARCRRETASNAINYNNGYTDIMLYTEPPTA